MIVVDASAVAAYLLNGHDAAKVEAVLFAPGQTLHAPHLIDLEIAQVVRRAAAAGRLNARRGQALLADLADMPITRYSHDLLLPRIWELRDNLTAYDAAYVALAELLDAPLLTRDARAANAPGHQARVQVV